jgi:hypothetical protein
VRVPLLFHLGAAAQVAPLVAAVLARRRLPRARAWTVAWCSFLVVVDAGALWMGRRGEHNLLLFNLQTPLSSVLVLWALSCWQPAELPRLTLRLAIIPFLLAWGVLTFALEDTSSFSRVAHPLADLVGLSAAAITLVARSHSAGGSLLRQDWFWVSGGVALYFGTATALAPLSALLVGEAPQLVIRAYEVKSVLDVFAFLAIARGVTCPVAT